MEIDFTLYWVRLPTHTDPYTEGYIGVTRRPIAVRFKAKISKKVQQCLDNGGIIQTLHILQGEDALYAMEQYYRPHPHIGLNTQTGGRFTNWEKGLNNLRNTPRKAAKAKIFSPAPRRRTRGYKTFIGPPEPTYEQRYPLPIGRPLLV